MFISVDSNLGLPPPLFFVKSSTSARPLILQRRKEHRPWGWRVHFPRKASERSPWTSLGTVGTVGTVTVKPGTKGVPFGGIWGHHGRVKPQNLVDLELFLVDLKPILGSKVLVSPGFAWFRSTSGYWVRVPLSRPGCVALRPVPVGRHSLRLWSGIVFWGSQRGWI